MIPCNTDFESLDPAVARVFRVFRTAAHAQRQVLDRVLADHGTHPAEAMCLRTIAGSPGISQRDLAELLHLSRPRITVLLQDLERKGQVVRRVDQEDQRLTRVYLTESGTQRAAELRTVFASVLRGTIGALSEEERLDLERLLTKIAELSSSLLMRLDQDDFTTTPIQEEST